MLKKFLIGTLVAVALMATSAYAADFGSTTLRVGSKGEAVKAVQTLVGATVDGSFGPRTKAKVQVWQAANDLKADGAFGPASRAKANATVSTTTPGTTTGTTVAGCPAGALFNSMTSAPCGTTTTGTTVVSGLTGSAGFLTYSNSSALSGESVGEGAVDEQVAGMKVKADTGSDLQLTAVKLVFVKVDGTGTHQKFQYYGKDVSIWLDGVKYGTVSGDTFTSDNSYTATVSLSAGAIVKKNTTGNLVVAVSGVPSLDSADAGKHWTVDFRMIRFVDAQGAVISEDPVYTPKDFSFDKFASAASLDLKTAIYTESPKEGIVSAKDSTTFDATLLKFTLKAKGSKVTVNKIPVLLTAAGHNTGVLATQATLSWTGGSDSQDVNAAAPTETVTFGATSDLGIVITEGNSMTFTVTTKMAKLVAANESDTMKAAVTVASIQSVDQTNTDITSTYLTGSATGDVQHMYTVAPVITVGTTSVTAIANGSTPTKADAYINVSIKAVGGTIYVNGAAESTALKEGLIVASIGDANTAISSYDFTPSGTYTTTNAGADNEYYTIEDGQTMNIKVGATLSQTVTNGIRAGLKITSVQFGTDVTSDTTRSAKIMNWTSLTDLLKTGTVTLN